MSPQAFYMVWETRRPKQPEDYNGNLSERDLEDLHNLIHEGD